MNRAHQLLRLQEVEEDIREKLALHKKVKAALENSPALKAAQEQVHSSQQSHEQLRRVQLMLEQELQTLDGKIKSESERLYGGTIKSHKEIEHLQREVESLQRRRGSLDEQALTGIEALEKATQTLQSSETTLTKVEAEWREQKSDLVAKEQKLKRYINARRRERDALLAEISAADLAAYRATQERKGAKAVAPLRDGVCGICGVNASATKLAQLRESDGLIECGNCGRILAS